jgi:hypothetical protein
MTQQNAALVEHSANAAAELKSPEQMRAEEVAKSRLPLAAGGARSRASLSGAIAHRASPRGAAHVATG